MPNTVQYASTVLVQVVHGVISTRDKRTAVIVVRFDYWSDQYRYDWGEYWGDSSSPTQNSIILVEQVGLQALSTIIGRA